MEDSIYIFFFFFIELTVNKFKANNAISTTNRNVWCEASYNVTYTFKNILSW